MKTSTIKYFFFSYYYYIQFVRLCQYYRTLLRMFLFCTNIGNVNTSIYFHGFIIIAVCFVWYIIGFPFLCCTQNDVLFVIFGAIQQGFLYAILAFGIYISFRILNIPDLTTEVCLWRSGLAVMNIVQNLTNLRMIITV